MKRLALIVATAALTACSTNPPPPAHSQSEPSLAPSASSHPRADDPDDFAHYSVLHARHTGLEQVFDDGQSVFLVFDEDQDTQQYRYFDQNGQPVAVRTSGRYAVVSGIHRGLLVRSASHYSYAQPAWVLANQPPRTPRKLTPIEAAARAASLVAINRLPSSSPQASEVTRKADGMSAALVRIYFPTGGATIRLSRLAKAELAEKAMSAESIVVRGRTDDTGSYAQNSRIAKARAVAVSRMVQQFGIPASRFKILSSPMSNYIASNDTEEGRALNRRAEIEFYPGS